MANPYISFAPAPPVILAVFGEIKEDLGTLVTGTKVFYIELPRVPKFNVNLLLWGHCVEFQKEILFLLNIKKYKLV